jgi:hypothetical protein
MRHVGWDNITPFLEIKDGGDDAGKKRGNHPRQGLSMQKKKNKPTSYKRWRMSLAIAMLNIRKRV